MGRVPRKKVKRVGSVSKKSKNSRSAKRRRSKANSSHTIVKENIPAKSVNGPNKINKNSNSSFEVIEIKDNSFSANSLETTETDSSVPVSNITSDENDIIDITDTTFIGNEPEKSQTVSSKLKTYNIEDDIIDITDTTFIGNEPEKSQTVSSKLKTYNIEDDIVDITDTTIEHTEHENSETASLNEKMPFCDDVQIISHTICDKKNPIELITISDDSDEENTPQTQSYENPIGYKSIKEYLGVNINTKKRTYNSPLRNRKKISKDECIHKEKTLPYNLGAFIIDKQRISHHSQYSNKFEFKTATFPQSHKASSSTTSKTNRKLRPIIIDGLNIGHAHGVGTFSVKGIDICVKYFADRGHKEIIAFIPQHRQGPPGSESNTILNALVKKGHICYTPSRKVQNLRMTCYDDRIILNYANRCGGVVVSNDNYRDLYEESEAFKEIIEQRQVMVTFVRDEIIVPDDQYNRRHDVRSLSDILCFSE